MQPLFSICIPTYNRADCIGECLNSVVSQLTEDMEIVILDGASTDATAEVLEPFLKSYPAIRFIRRNRNYGIDADILKVVELAQGEYCWLLSDDDQLEPGAVRRIRSCLEQQAGLGGISVNSQAFDKTMSYQIRTVPAIAHGQINGDHLFTDRNECFSMLGIHFGYLSAQVVHRPLWQQVARASDVAPYLGSCWILVYMIGRMLEANSRWLYIHEPLVRYRSGNDSFAGRMGTLRRQKVTHDAYAKVLHGLFARGSSVSRRVLRILVEDRMPRTLANTKANGASLYLQARLWIMYTERYWRYPAYWWKVVPLFAIPNFVYRGVRSLYMRVNARKRTCSQVAFPSEGSSSAFPPPEDKA
jgi:abequosyltransferase